MLSCKDLIMCNLFLMSYRKPVRKWFLKMYTRVITQILPIPCVKGNVVYGCHPKTKTRCSQEPQESINRKSLCWTYSLGFIYFIFSFYLSIQI